MTIPSNYEINISVLKNDNRYHHLANVELGSHLPEDIMEKYRVFAEKFPKEEGYSLTLYEVDCRARIIERSN